MPATLNSRIPAIIAGLDERVNLAVKAGAEAIAENAKNRVHVRTGALRDSIAVNEASDGVYYVVAGELYGIFEEFGTSDTPSHPFLVPAAEETKDEIEHLVTASLQSL